ncbi:unnamed protein product [Mytilus coruscus]|uniref:Reverse transcriptase domain-containing protein n=1 Tax=Mytilus coruscus TaxID=42192 RepID=A0A6J8CBV0_MYTCO|nr:unnamed protein product [Mytilus coruscus]
MTSDHLFVLKTLIDKHTQKDSKPLYTCFVDFRGAFDTVNHTGLFYKLSKIGVGTHFYNIIKSMYSNNILCIKTRNMLTADFRSCIGVRQGDNLSPSLFKMFINDFKSLLDETCDPVLLSNISLNCLLYADDLVLLSESKIGLQTALNKLEIYCENWGLEVNLKKTKSIVFNTSGRIKDA